MSLGDRVSLLPTFPTFLIEKDGGIFGIGDTVGGLLQSLQMQSRCLAQGRHWQYTHLGGVSISLSQDGMHIHFAWGVGSTCKAWQSCSVRAKQGEDRKDSKGQGAQGALVDKNKYTAPAWATTARWHSGAPRAPAWG